MSSSQPAASGHKAEELIALMRQIGDDGRTDVYTAARFILLSDDPYVLCLLTADDSRTIQRKAKAVLRAADEETAARAAPPR